MDPIVDGKHFLKRNYIVAEVYYVVTMVASIPTVSILFFLVIIPYTIQCNHYLRSIYIVLAVINHLEMT